MDNYEISVCKHVNFNICISSIDIIHKLTAYEKGEVLRCLFQYMYDGAYETRNRVADVAVQHLIERNEGYCDE